MSQGPSLRLPCSSILLACFLLEALDSATPDRIQLPTTTNFLSPMSCVCSSPAPCLIWLHRTLASSCDKCDRLSQLPSSLNYHLTLCFPPGFTSDPTTGVFSLPQSWHYKKAHCIWAHVSLLTPGLHLSCHDNPAPVLWAPGDPDRLCLQRQFRPRINNRDESQACLFTLFPGPLRLRINSNKVPTTPDNFPLISIFHFTSK